MPFGQVVVGPAGSGKSTYCHGMKQFLPMVGRRVAVVNMDPANDSLLYEADIDIMDLVSLYDVMEEHEMGPNGGMMFCMEYIEQNLDWLVEKLRSFKEHYVIFDMPGQIELYTHHQSVQRIMQFLNKTCQFRLCAVHLVDAHHCSDPAKFVSAVLLSLSTMLRLELPHVNVLSKVDLIETYGKLDLPLEHYTEGQGLVDVLQCMYNQSDYEAQLGADLEGVEEPVIREPSAADAKFHRLQECLVEVVEEYGLVHFYTLFIEDKEAMENLIKAIDRANGWVFGGLDSITSSEHLFNSYGVEDFESRDKIHGKIEGKFMAPRVG